MQSGLYIVGTPIGNLSDLTYRGVEVLKEASLIAAEDTRETKKLLQYYGINSPLIAYHDHNEQQQTLKLIQKLQQGDTIALVSDAGTPLIRDPGFHLVQAAHQNQIPVIPIPGCCAAIAALSASGFDANQFQFEGFLAVKQSARIKQLQVLANNTRTLVFYESPHRVVDTLTDMLQIFGEAREITIAREITKKFETIIRTTLGKLLQQVEKEQVTLKGEFVIVLAGAELLEKKQQISAEHIEVLKILMQELPLKKAAHLAAKICGQSKNKLYALGVSLNAQT